MSHLLAIVVLASLFLTPFAYFVYGVVAGSVAYALVVKKNPKVQADVAKAASQVQSTASTVAADAKADAKKV